MGGYVRERTDAYSAGNNIFGSAFNAANPYENTINAAQNPLSFSTGGLLGGSGGVATFNTGGAGIQNSSLTGGLSNQNNSYALIALAAYFGYNSYQEWAAAQPAAAEAAAETVAVGGGVDAAAQNSIDAGATASSPTAPAASSGVPVSGTTTMTTTNPITGATQASGTGTFGTGQSTTSNAGFWNTAGNWVTSPQGIGTIANLGAGLLQGQSAQNAAENQSAAQLEASRLASEAARFRPVGVTTGFGASQFGYDPSGRLISAGYQLTPEMQRQRDLLISQSGGMLDQAIAGRQATAPMGTAAQSMFNLGQGYLGTSPQQQAARYMEEQQALLAPIRERELAQLQNTMQQQGRGGLAIGGTSTGMMASNPQLEAFYNAQRQQDLGLAAQATQGGMDYAKFGAGMVGLGGTTLRDMYGTQQASYDPYTTSLQGAQRVEQLGQGAMDIGTSIGQQVSTAGVNQGNFITGGQQNAAPYQVNAQSYNPWATMLGGFGQSMNRYSNQNNQWSY